MDPFIAKMKDLSQKGKKNLQSLLKHKKIDMLMMGDGQVGQGSKELNDEGENETQDQDSSDGGDNMMEQDGSDVDSVQSPSTVAGSTFLSPEVAYQDNNVKFTVQKVKHKKFNQFHLEDSLYEIKVRTLKPDATPPLLLSLEKGLKGAVTYLFDKLKTSNNPEEHRQVYSTVCEKNIINGLNTGNYSLNWPSTTLARQVLNVFHSYLKSHETMRLSDSFKVNAKLLSVRHANMLEKTNKKFRKDIHYGMKRSHVSERKQKWQFLLNKSQDNCLLQSLTIAYFQCLALESTGDNTFLKMKRLHSGTKKQRQLAQDLICEKTELLAEKLQVPLAGPHTLETVAPPMTAFYQCQIHVFAKGTMKWQRSFPAEQDDTKRQIYLLATTNNEEIEHVEPIENIITFFNKFGKWCRYCKTTTTSPSYEHYCKKVNMCFSCHRKPVCSDTYTNKFERHFFCDSKGEKDKSTCETCHALVEVETLCYSHHKKKVCGRGYTCQSCKTYIPAINKSIAQIKETHQCGETPPCRFCDLPFAKNHLCRLRKENFQKEYTNLAFLKCEAITQSVSYCENCSKINYPCDTCKDAPQTCYDHPNLAILFYESTTRGNFNKVIFSDFAISETDSKVKNAFNATHMLPDVLQKEPLSEIRWEVQYGKSAKRRVNTNIFEKKEMSVVDQILDYILKMDFRNTTILCHGGASFELHFLAKALALAGVKPRTVVKKNKIISIEFGQAGCRFIDVDNYLDCSLFQLSLRHNLDYVFFPKSMNKEKYYLYNGNVPPLSAWWEPEDYDKVYQEKKQEFINDLDTINWNWKDQIISHCQQKIIICIVAAFKYLCLCQKSQNIFWKELCNIPVPKPKEKMFYHPFNRPHCTVAGFNYKTFKLFCEEDIKEVKIIKNEESGVFFNSSKKELQWVSYVLHQMGYPPDFVWAFSPLGQKTCKHRGEVIPDFCVGNTAGFFLGCVWHRHDRSECEIMKEKKDTILYGKTDEQVRADDIRKLELFKKNHPEIINYDFMYECHWMKMKKDDNDVKSFLDNEYNQYPAFRLVPRVAGKPYYHIIIKNIFIHFNMFILRIFQCAEEHVRFMLVYGTKVRVQMRRLNFSIVTHSTQTLASTMNFLYLHIR